MVYTVTQISNDIKTTLLKGIPDKLIVEGEISNFKVSNGNMFFTLKDEESSISVVSWSFEKYFSADGLGNGDKVQVHGKLACYIKNGTYSLQTFKVEKQGIGDLHSAYEKLKKVYQNKGYFSDDIKKKLPSNLKNIGIITSPEGAAIQDILFVLNKNKFQGKVFIKRCMVQGNSCAKSIVESIEYLNNFKFQEGKSKKKLDLLMVTRGGGSFEDLMGYSDPKVIEAIYESDIFVMSAVGHEIDFMLSDFAADLRAPTPSIGAEIISKKNKEKLEVFTDLENYINTNLQEKISNIIISYKSKLDILSLLNKNPVESLDNKITELNLLEEKLSKFMENQVTLYNLKFSNIEKKLEKFNFDKFDDMGVAQVMIKNKNGEFIPCCSIHDFKNFDETDKIIKLVFSDGNITIKTKKIDINTSS
jgi:exodeoxyribonuclease VII large subunit